jgi:aspartate aminotransferase
MFSKRILQMKPSATVELNNKVLELKRQGKDIIALNVGEPDFNTPENINRAACQAIADEFTKYTPVSGIYELKSAVCKKLQDDQHLEYIPDEILIATGAKQALVNAVLTLCDQGDEVIILTPCWVSYIEIVKMAESSPVFVATDESNGFQLDLKNIRAHISDRTKAFIINTPNNPTGAVYREEALRELAELAVKHDFFIFSDEVYEKLVYDGAQHFSIAQFSPEIRARTIVINGLSKAYAMTGWRIGYAAGPADIINNMSRIQGHVTTCANSVAQKAAVEALLGPQESITIMRKEYDQRRQYIIARLNNMAGITCQNVEGAFYVFPHVAEYFGKKYRGTIIEHSIDFAQYLLEEAQIAVVPGIAFESPNYIRISYANSLENIKKAMDRMETSLSML